MISKHRRDQLKGEDEMTALMRRVEANGAMHRIKLDGDSINEHFDYSERNPEILRQAWTTSIVQMDCTYRTNKYGIQMLHVVSTNLNKMYTLAYCFMSSTLQVDYKWVLDA